MISSALAYFSEKNRMTISDFFDVIAEGFEAFAKCDLEIYWPNRTLYIVSLLPVFFAGGMIAFFSLVKNCPRILRNERLLLDTFASAGIFGLAVTFCYALLLLLCLPDKVEISSFESSTTFFISCICCVVGVYYFVKSYFYVGKIE